MPEKMQAGTRTREYLTRPSRPTSNPDGRVTMHQVIMLLRTFLILSLPASALGQTAAPVDVQIPAPPSPFLAEGSTHLVYELHVSNFGSRDITVREVAALDADRRTTLVAYRDEALAGNVRIPGAAPDSVEPTRVSGGRRAVIFIWIDLSGAATPAALSHRLTLLRDGDSTDVVFETESQSLASAAVAIGPPLRGANWLAANGPDNVMGHRRALIPVGGKARIAQRFAIDWVQIVDGRTFDGDQDDNSTYYAWGQDALAVADGIVVATKDSIPENVPGINSRAVPITLETVGGNYVIIDIGDGRYAFYAHLQPGSLRVAVGDRVRRGDVVGLVGNSGNSTEPHLHFHVADAASPLGAEGIPYVFEQFEITGRMASFGQPPETWDAQVHRSEIPLGFRIVRFEGR